MKIILAAALLACLAGCAHETPEQASANRETAKKFITDRAAFDLKCDADKLQVTLLGGLPVYDFGVRGCGQQCKYRVLCDSNANCEVSGETKCTADNGATK